MLEEFGGKNEVEVLDRYKIENSKRDALRGGGAPLEWGGVRWSGERGVGGGKVAGRGSLLCSESATCSDCKASRRSRRKKKKR